MKYSKLFSLSSFFFVNSFIFCSATSATEHCYDFSRASTTPHKVGDVIKTDFATITILPLRVNGENTNNDAQKAVVTNSVIAGGSAPELQLTQTSIHIRPINPIKKLTARIAQNTGNNGAAADAIVRVNRQAYEVPNGFAAMNGKSIGRKSIGQATITSKLHAVGDGNWVSGEITLEAKQGVIEGVALGANTWRADDFCLYD